ncbi:MAG: Asp-tRNA(Asn)/Glu-tRNA(Gln) amidotransferase subunit GatC [Ignavibacteriales bacterium]|nr:Asp-tRNA(Asn)/Glu-tRNA(Gln) amidotransferase subunit GatC [Ignavibacteriales bacterium]
MVTKYDVDNIAKLARLDFPDSEKEKLTEKFNDILKMMDKLNELDTTNIEPLTHILPLQNVFREDVTKESEPREDILKNAPSATEEFFKVPKVIG